MQEKGQAEVYGIYFDFASDKIKPESEPVLKEIADALGTIPRGNCALKATPIMSVETSTTWTCHNVVQKQ